jgi:hypothetical protein
MVSVPYVALGTIGFMIYRGYRKNERFKLLMQAGEADGGSHPAPIAGNDSSD